MLLHNSSACYWDFGAVPCRAQEGHCRWQGMPVPGHAGQAATPAATSAGHAACQHAAGSLLSKGKAGPVPQAGQAPHESGSRSQLLPLCWRGKSRACKWDFLWRRSCPAGEEPRGAGFTQCAKMPPLLESLGRGWLQLWLPCWQLWEQHWASVHGRCRVPTCTCLPLLLGGGCSESDGAGAGNRQVQSLGETVACGPLFLDSKPGLKQLHVKRGVRQ